MAAASEDAVLFRRAGETASIVVIHCEVETVASVRLSRGSTTADAISQPEGTEGELADLPGGSVASVYAFPGVLDARAGERPSNAEPLTLEVDLASADGAQRRSMEQSVPSALLDEQGLALGEERFELRFDEGLVNLLAAGQVEVCR